MQRPLRRVPALWWFPFLVLHFVLSCAEEGATGFRVQVEASTPNGEFGGRVGSGSWLPYRAFAFTEHGPQRGPEFDQRLLQVR